MEHAAALAVPANPLEQVHPDTENVLFVKSPSFLFALKYPVVEVGVMHGVEHTTPPLFEEAAAQVVPPKETVHGLFGEQVVILEVVPEMSIVVFESMMVTKSVEEAMERSLP